MNSKFYEKPWFMWLMLIFIAPVGIFLLWKYGKFSPSIKGALSVVFAAIFIFMMVVTQTGDKQPDTQASIQEPQQTQQPANTAKTIGKEQSEVKEYKIAKVEELHFSNVKRFAYEVVVKEQTGVDDIKLIAEEVLKKAKKDTPFNALSIGFYDYEEYIGHGYSLGKTEFAPQGDWSKADTVKTADYAKMQFNWDFTEKDWDKRLTQDEVVIWKAWKDTYYSKDNNNANEDDVTKAIADQFKISAEDVKSILTKQSQWVYNY